MEGHRGEVFEGIISSLTGWGMYVELENTIEGMVPVSEMRDDYYIFDDISMTMTGEASGKCYRLGDRVKVEVWKVDRAEGAIDFLLVED